LRNYFHLSFKNSFRQKFACFCVQLHCVLGIYDGNDKIIGIARLRVVDSDQRKRRTTICRKTNALGSTKQ
jgi:hypothetical protein